MKSRVIVRANFHSGFYYESSWEVNSQSEGRFSQQNRATIFVIYNALKNLEYLCCLSWSLRIPSLAYIPLLFGAFALCSSRFCRARWSGPCDKEYTSDMWSLTSRLPRPFDGHFFEHWKPGSVPLHTITWQWTNTNGWSAMNLKASRLNRCALAEGAAWYFTVLSLGHLINAKS